MFLYTFEYYDGNHLNLSIIGKIYFLLILIFLVSCVSWVPRYLLTVFKDLTYVLNIVYI